MAALANMQTGWGKPGHTGDDEEREEGRKSKR